MLVELDHVGKWMAYMREHPENRDRFLECFWPSQIKSKEWLISTMESLGVPCYTDTVYIFGGWYGILAQLISYYFNVKKVYSIDVDPRCELIGPLAGASSDRSCFVTADMATYEYPDHPSIVVNTSCEHVSQETYDAWWSKVPKGTYFFLQGNDFVIDEHIRCSENVTHFIVQSRVAEDPTTKYKYGSIECPGPFNRFMVWGWK